MLYVMEASHGSWSSSRDAKASMWCGTVSSSSQATHLKEDSSQMIIQGHPITWFFLEKLSRCFIGRHGLLVGLLCLTYTPQWYMVTRFSRGEFESPWFAIMGHLRKDESRYMIEVVEQYFHITLKWARWTLIISYYNGFHQFKQLSKTTTRSICCDEFCTTVQFLNLVRAPRDSLLYSLRVLQQYLNSVTALLRRDNALLQ